MSLYRRTCILVIAAVLTLPLTQVANAAIAERHLDMSHSPDPSGLSRATAALNKYESASTDSNKRKAFSELEASLIAAIKQRPGTVTLLKKYLATKKTSESQAAAVANTEKVLSNLKIALIGATNDVTKAQSAYDAAILNGTAGSTAQKVDTTAVDLALKSLDTSKQALINANSDFIDAQSALVAGQARASLASKNYALATKALTASPIGVLLVKTVQFQSNSLASLSQRI